MRCRDVWGVRIPPHTVERVLCERIRGQGPADWGWGSRGRGSVQVGPLLWGSVGESEADWGKRGNPPGRAGPDRLFRTDQVHLGRSVRGVPSG